MKRRMLVALAVALLAFVTACSGSDGDTDPDDGASTTDDEQISVYANARLQRDLELLDAAYAEEQPGVQIEFTFGGSEELADALGESDDPDLYIDIRARVDNRLARGDLGLPLDLGSDVLQIVVAPANPTDISGLAVFGDDPTTLSGLCAEDVGCGQSARRVLEAAGVTPAPDQIEPTATDLLAAVADGEIDAGLLFRSQIVSAPTRTVGIDLAADNNAEVYYAIGVLSDNAEAAAFADWLVESEAANAILIERGFRARG